MSRIGLSVIIPVYNAEEWMKPTITRIVNALQKAKFEAEIIVIDDGSADKTAENAKAVEVPASIPLKVISNKKNLGRYLARKTGVKATKYDNILFVDSRVFIDEGSLAFLYKQLEKDPDQIWNGHVNIDKKGNLFARFWDAIVCISWRKYFRHPKTTSYGVEEFDFYPKGTTFFEVPKKRLLAAMEYFEKQTNDIKNSSDDTLLIRFMIERQNIHLSPSFSCLYHNRTSFKAFLKHAHFRGQVFIDGFLRPGNRYFIPLILVLLLMVAVVVFGVLMPQVALPLVAAGLLLFVVGLFVGALLFGIIIQDAFALAILGIPFALVYAAGLWIGVVRMLRR